MYSLKAFLSLAGFPNNTPHQTALIGELSSQSMTYSKEQGEYVHNDHKDLLLVSFHSKLDEALVSIPVDVKENVFDVLGWTYGQMMTNTTTQDRTNFLVALIDTFPIEVAEVDCGAIVNDGTHYIPEWLAWRIPNTDSFIRIWFTDAAFQAQYDEFEIVVIPALTTLNNFFLQASDVKIRLEAMTTTLMVDRMQQAKANYPETIMKVETYNYIAPGNPTLKIPSRWGVLIYGAAGNNIDSIKDALIAYILANSTHTREEWAALLPDLFKRTEFVFTPLWNQYAIPNRTLEAGIYGPLVKHADAAAIVEQTASAWPPAHIKNYLSSLNHPYKSLAVLVVGGPDNREGKFYFTDFYSDFIAINTSSVDFNRMSLETQEVATALAEMIMQAESVSKYTVLPFGMTRLMRNGILYVVKTLNNIQLLVVAKSSFPAEPENV